MGSGPRWHALQALHHYHNDSHNDTTTHFPILLRITTGAIMMAWSPRLT